MMQILLLLALACGAIASTGLETVSDDELLNLFRGEKYVVVLFTRKDCSDCEKYENALINIREDLVDTLNAWVVQAQNSQLVKLYNPSKEPAIVFFRHGVPLLYDGEPNDEVMLHMFSENKEPAVKELSDENFESLTQVATGATTGDWFIMFYSNECVECQRLQARWEAVGAKLKTRMNVARVNRYTTGRVTSRRFQVSETPTFIFFRLGKMYQYNIPKYDVASFVSFATGFYENARPEKVPLPKSPFDDFTQMIADYLRDNPWLWKVASLSVCIGLLCSFFIKLRLVEQAEKEKKEKKPEASSSKSEQTKKSK